MKMPMEKEKTNRTPDGKSFNVFVIITLLLIVTVMISFVLGRYEITISDVISSFAAGIRKNESVDPAVQKVIINIRLPRIILACLVGGSLSVAGCSFQTIFHNPMASPDILGASQGACLGAAIGILLNFSSSGVVVFAFIFSLSTIGLVYLISMFAKDRNLVSILLAGIVVGSLFSAATSYVKLVADSENQLPQITYWLMGSFSGTKLSDLVFSSIAILIGLVPLMLLRWRMNLLTCPDEEAATMGVNIKRLRLVVILCSTLLTATGVAFSGMIGWVGLAVPHFCRFLVGNNLKKLLPASMIVGATFLLIIDNISRNLLTTEIPIGILTAFIGAPFFIVMLIRGERV